jgi:hypothetical protein
LLGGLRERLAVAETKSALMTTSAPIVDMPVERLNALEAKSATFVSESFVSELGRRVEALERRQEPVLVVSAEDVAGLRDRLVSVETKAAGLESRGADPWLPAVERVDRVVAELSRDIGTIRERVAVAEVRALAPGPAGKDGKDGKDGADGIGFDDMAVEFDGDRTITIKAESGLKKKSWPIALPFLRQKGVYVDGAEYVEGDVVTWAGSQWHANEATTSKPGNGSKAWTLVVKCGRDGKDGRDAPGALPVVTVGARG